MITAYLATPAVFRPDAKAYGEKLKTLCLKYGVIGKYPLDNESTNSLTIYKGNTDLIEECDIILADVIPFRGPSLDVGVSFEVGYGIALGKPVIAYNVPYSYYQTRVFEHDQDSRLDFYCNDGWNVENFDLSDNLMLAHSYDKACPTLENALEWLKQQLS